MCICRQTYIRTYLRRYIRTYVHTYLHAYIHTYVYIHGFKPCSPAETPSSKPEALIKGARQLLHGAAGLPARLVHSWTGISKIMFKNPACRYMYKNPKQYDSTVHTGSCVIAIINSTTPKCTHNLIMIIMMGIRAMILVTVARLGTSAEAALLNLAGDPTANITECFWVLIGADDSWNLPYTILPHVLGFGYMRPCWVSITKRLIVEILHVSTKPP